MERRQASKFMNILGVIIDETSSAKKKKVPKGVKKQASAEGHLRHVDEGWLRRCSANSLPLTSDEEDDELIKYKVPLSRPKKSKASKALFSASSDDEDKKDGLVQKEAKPLTKKFKASTSISEPTTVVTDVAKEPDSGVALDLLSGITFSLEDLQDAIIETRKDSDLGVDPSDLISEISPNLDLDSGVDSVEKENPKKRPLEAYDGNNEDQGIEETGQPKRKFFKSRAYAPDQSKPRFKLSFRKSPKKRTPNGSCKKKPTSNSKANEDFDFESGIDEEKLSNDDKDKPTKRPGMKPGTTTNKTAPAGKRTTKAKTDSTKRRTRSKAEEMNSPSASEVAPNEDEATSKENASKLTAVYDVYDEVANLNNGNFKGSRRGGRRNYGAAAKRTLKNVNDNFVRIDVEKKRFVRGKKKMSGEKRKRNDWKLKKAFAAKEAKVKTTKCRKCGEFGHYAMYCMKDMMDKDIIPEATDDSPFPTLEEAAQMTWSKRDQISFSRLPDANVNGKPESLDGSFNEGRPTSDVDISMEEGHFSTVTQSATFVLTASTVKSVDPILDIGDAPGEEKLLMKGLGMFKFESFRPGQREAIARVLQGLSTLLVLGTGCGKSLCYLLPAYLYAERYPGALSLCISPLVSLMEDQIKHVPNFLNAACLHTQMTTRQKEIVLDKIKNKKLDILLVSPEAICSGLFGLLRNVEDFPPVAFACIDEVHCVSEWSHNFRPSYLKLCKVLRDKLNIRTILGLTATATNYTAFSVCEHLKIDPSSRIQGELLPSNLNLSVSKDVERDHALIELLHGERFKTCDSIIIYCTRRSECERIVTLIRTALKPVCASDSNQVVCDAYHAGQRASHRRRVQNDFMAGKIRIVVATVAFGMGINKSNIRAIIHYNMPKTFESYVQEIGRAGRDGKSAECHIFLGSNKGKDLAELRRHIYGNFVDRSTLRNLIKKIFRPCKCGKIDKLRGVSSPDEKRRCCGHEVSFSVADTSLDLDLAEENIETLLCYMELDTKRKWIEILPKCYQQCKLQTYGGAKLLLAKSRTCPPLAAAIAMQKENKRFKEGTTHLEFNLVELASTLGWNSAVVRRELKSLEWTGIKFDAEGKPVAFRKSGILVEFSDLAHRVIVPGDLADEDYDELLNTLHDRCVQQERMQLYQLQKTHEAFQLVSTPNILSACDNFDRTRCEKLKSMILEYFSQKSVQVPSDWKPKLERIPVDTEETIKQDILNLFASQRETTFTGRAVAKIFQGISSPCFPADHWNRNRSFWRKHIDVDFHALVRIASEEVVSHQ